MTEEEQFTADFNRLLPAVMKSVTAGMPTHTEQDIVDAIAQGKMHFWPIGDSAVITEVSEAPEMRYLNIYIGAGDLDELLGCLPRLESWAKHLGCSYLCFVGRKGFSPHLVKRGWRDHHMTYYSKAI